MIRDIGIKRRLPDREHRVRHLAEHADAPAAKPDGHFRAVGILVPLDSLVGSLEEPTQMKKASLQPASRRGTPVNWNQVMTVVLIVIVSVRAEAG